MIGVIAQREIGTLFRSPLAWAILAMGQAALAFLFLLHLESYLELQPRMQESPGVTAWLAPRLYGATAGLMLFLVPLLTMRLIAGERQLGTLPLLLSAPAASIEIILGKYIGTFCLLALLTALVTLMPLSLAVATPIDITALLLAAVGVVLFAALAGAAGLYLSALAHQPMIAAIGTAGLLLFLLLFGEWASTVDANWTAAAMWLTPSTHLQPFLRGLFDTGALAYFLIMTGVFLALAVRRLDNERLQR